MLSIQKKLNFPFLAILGLPATAVGFSLSTQIAALSWLLSTRFGLDIHAVALVWLAGPLAGIIGQPIVGVISDNAWFLGGRRKGFIMIGGVIGALMFLALPQIGVISSALGFEGVIVIATIIALLLDLSINVTFNPARAIIADLTPEGEKRTSGYTIMQLFSGTFGLLAYFISIVLGNMVLLSIAVGLVFLFSVLPCLFIEEDRNVQSNDQGQGGSPAKTSIAEIFRIIYPLSGFLIFAGYLIVDKLLLAGMFERYQVGMTLTCVGVSLILGIIVVFRGYKAPSNLNEFHKIMVAHAFSWLGIQSMFVMSFFFATEVVVPNMHADGSLANGFANLMRFESKAEVASLKTYAFPENAFEGGLISDLETLSAVAEALEDEDLQGVSTAGVIDILSALEKAHLVDLLEEIRAELPGHPPLTANEEIGAAGVPVLVGQILEAKAQIQDSVVAKKYASIEDVPTICAHLLVSEIQGRTAGNILSFAFLLFNFIGAFLPVMILQPLSKTFGRVRVYTTSILIMALAYLSIWLFGKTEFTFYLGICTAGIGWAAVISIVFAIMSERVDKQRMGLNMGLFNYSVVLPQMMTVGVAAFIRDSGDYSQLFLLCGLALSVSFVFWLFVKEPQRGNS